MEKGLSDDNTSAVSCPGAIVARCMDTVVSMPFSLMINAWSLILMIWNGPIVLGMSILYAIVAILSVALTKEVASGSLSMQTSCLGENTGTFPTLFS